MKINMTGVQWPRQCEMCKQHAELRPYGPQGENVCFTCAMKDESSMEAQFERRMTQDAISVEDFQAVISGSKKGH